MPLAASRNRFRACLLTSSLLFAQFAFADIFEPTPFVPPANGVYTLANTCIGPVCLENIALSDFTDTKSVISGGNDLTTSDVSLMADAFQNVGGAPGVFISPVTLNGTVGITYLNKSTLSENGTFADVLTGLLVSGSFSGLTGTHEITAMLNPDQSSTGQTTITKVGASEFRINSFFDVFAELSIDGGPFVPGPERVAELSATPEPAYYVVIGLLSAGIVARRVVGRKRLGARSQAS